MMTWRRKSGETNASSHVDRVITRLDSVKPGSISELTHLHISFPKTLPTSSESARKCEKMARNSVLLRHLLRVSPSSRVRSSSSVIETLASSPIAVPSPPIHSMPSFFTTATANSQFSRPFFNYRTLCSSSGQSKIALIKSEEEFNTSLSKAQDESLPAIFYFTAVWCGPCRFIAPIIAELSEKYPHVTTYKIDIDQDGLENTLRTLNITSVPTLHFFQNGKKAAEIIGADVARLKDTMDKLYKKD